MKKLLVTAGLMMLTASMACASTTPTCPVDGCPPPPPCAQKPAPPKMDLDKRLNLTEEQKVKAREIRMEGAKEIRPLIDKLKSKQEQKRILLSSQINKKEQIEMIDDLNEEISKLKKQIHDVRVKNMKDFEAILTPKQKATLDKMKMESRKNFHKNHKCKHQKAKRPCPCNCHK